MSKSSQQHSKDAPAPTEPIDVVGGIADHSSKPAKWKLLMLLAVFVGWVAVMVYVQIAGSRS